MSSKKPFLQAIELGSQALITLGICLSCVTTMAQAQETAGKTIMARGSVSAVNMDNGERALERRSPVFKIDNVNTGQLSATQLRMIDGGLLSLQEDTELAIAEYAFDTQTEQGSVSMSLVKGGLRTVTGALQSNQDNYRLNTPIASIGVRGTHYEAELFDDDLYLAGWEGTIDISVDSTSTQFSLGPEENYRFAIVRSDGTVEFLLNAPALFTDGHSNDIITLTSERPAQMNYSLAGATQVDPIVNFEPIVIEDTFGEEFVDNDRLIARLLPNEQGVIRTGSATFDQLSSAQFNSSVGAVSNINVSITVDFNTASIPTGNLSFQDSQGEWFAAFNGLIDSNALDLNINFASHNNNLVDGVINGLFIENASSILGNVNLFEINQPGVQAGGSFIVTERTP